MISSPLLLLSSALGYELLFGVAALACFAAAVRAWQVDDPELRNGLTALLVTSGGWAVTHVGMFLLPRPFRQASYLVGLILGFSTVWVWLYFCSAYTGRSYHREPVFRWVAVAIYLAVVAVKVTNPLHHLYFRTEYVTAPFPHLTIQQGVFHWAVTGFSYALATAGIFMLLELYVESDYDTRPLVALVALTVLPVALDVVGYATPALVDIIYAPLGVAAFAVGVLFLFRERFLAVRATGEVEDPLVFLDDDGHIRDVNDRARERFDLADAVGEPLEAVVPGVLRAAENDELFEYEVDGQRRYFLVSNSVFQLGRRQVGQVVVFSDVTETESRRRELARHNRQLEDFAGAMTHELRNSLQIVDWNVRAASEALDGDQFGGTPLDTATDTTGRMSDLVDDFTLLARHGQTVEETTTVDLREIAEDAWRTAETGDLSLSVDGTGAVEADPTRLRALLASAFEFAVRNGASEVAVEPLADGFAIADDGEPPGDADAAKFFQYDEAVPHAKAGMKLPNVRSLARVHGWEAAIDTDYDAGVRVVVSGVRVAEAAEREPAGET